MAMRPRLALTMGDPAGIGPELCLTVSAMPLVQKAAEVVLVGSEAVFRKTARELKLPAVWEVSREGEPPIRIVDIGPPQGGQLGSPDSRDRG